MMMMHRMDWRFYALIEVESLPFVRRSSERAGNIYMWDYYSIKQEIPCSCCNIDVSILLPILNQLSCALVWISFLRKIVLPCKIWMNHNAFLNDFLKLPYTSDFSWWHVREVDIWQCRDIFIWSICHLLAYFRTVVRYKMSVCPTE